MVDLALVFIGEAFMKVSKLVVIAHLPVMIIKGNITAFCVAFLKQLKPEILGVAHAPIKSAK